ncbi:MAG: cobalamin biosynthesis protein CobT [Gammaproteobacteria bacterium]|nr:cobalamin biosynthesis protein CobT [Gammaproteobacteria bacterium]
MSANELSTNSPIEQGRPENSHARTRQLERHGTACIRALSAFTSAEYRARRLRVDGKPVPYASPHLSLDFSSATLARSRGVSDSLAVRLRYSDLNLHHSLAPVQPLARVIFDILEQLRAESQVPPHFVGVRANLDDAFLAWCLESRANGLVESSLGILLYTVIHMVRARLINNRDDEEVEALIEATRANLGPLIGKPFYQLSKTRHDQAAFAGHALEIAELVTELVGEESDDAGETESTLARHSVILGPDWDSQDLDLAEDGAGGIGGGAMATAEESLENAGDYRSFSTEFDKVVSGEQLYRQEQRDKLRSELDQQVRGQAVSVTRLALRLQRLFATPEVDGWLFGQDEGVIDGRRLSQLVSNPAYRQVFRQTRLQPICDTVVSFLIDNSGSMKAQRFEAVAVLIDTYARALDLAGAKSEILGFTTGDWNGGRVMKAWRAAGMPSQPGRLNELMHIVYKDADTPWKRARSSLASMLKPQHFREGVDGEALVWAYRRLQQRPEQRRILVIVSDGAPMDAATFNANRAGFMTDHLQSVARFLQQQRTIELGAIGIDLDLSDVYHNSLMLDLEGTLTNRSYAALESLFRTR